MWMADTTHGLEYARSRLLGLLKGQTRAGRPHVQTGLDQHMVKRRLRATNPAHVSLALPTLWQNYDNFVANMPPKRPSKRTLL
jgi:hypothetical protein